MATKTLSTVRKVTKLQVQSHKAKTLRKEYGVLVGDRLVFQSDSNKKATQFAQEKGIGCVVNFSGLTARTRRKHDRDFRQRQEMTNPIADQLSHRHASLLYALDEIGKGLYCIEGPRGIVYGNTVKKTCDRAATDEESSRAEVSFYADVAFDLRGGTAEVAASAAAALRQMARDLMAKAREIELDSKRGFLPQSFKHFYVQVDGQCAYGPTLDLYACFDAERRLEGKLMCVFDDDTEEPYAEETIQE